MGIIFALLQLLIVTNMLANAKMVEEKTETVERDGKILPVFQVVRFPNDICKGTSRNGTCYTAEECSSKGGTKDTSCASGFGVCCIFTLACGGSASENQTYIYQASATKVSSPCTHSICPASSNICRIRYDFKALVLASPITGTSDGKTKVEGNGIGSCTTDAMAISTVGFAGSPVICGTNTGYHMVLDSNGVDCQMVNMQIGGATTTTRSWDIKVTQYNCGDEDMGGPMGCLQYWTGTSGYISSYNFPPTATASTMTATVTHLKNQYYKACVRRASGYCYICYSVKLDGAGTAAITQRSFGLTTSASATISQSKSGQVCDTDFIEIPQACLESVAKVTTTTTRVTRLCGHQFSSITANAASIAADKTVCSRTSPFTLGVNFDDRELSSKGTKSTESEIVGFPGGIVGFALQYWQGTC